MENQLNQNPSPKGETNVNNVQGPITKASESTKGFSEDNDAAAGAVQADGLTSDADTQVRATEDASLQDDSYAFDEDNTNNEDIHDVSDFGDMDSGLFDSQEDYS